MRMPDSHVCLKYEKPRRVICVRNGGKRLLPWCMRLLHRNGGRDESNTKVPQHVPRP